MLALRMMVLAAVIVTLTAARSYAEQASAVNECVHPAKDQAIARQLESQAKACRETATFLRERAARLRIESSAGGPGVEVKNANPELPAALETAAQVVEKKANEAEAEDPYFPLGNKWSLSYTAFIGLLRVTLKTKTGIADKFEPLSGIGTGLKFSYNRLNEKNKRLELFGVGAGFYFEPKIKVSGQDATAQALSAILVVSAVSKFYVGVTYKIASNEPAFSRDNGPENVGLVFGGGFDGSML